jgi:hypothetical protein
MMLEICTVIFSDKRTVLSKCVLGVLYLSPILELDKGSVLFIDFLMVWKFSFLFHTFNLI